MKRPTPQAGYAGLGVAVAGVLIAAFGALTSTKTSSPWLPMLVGAALYLVGSLLAVAAFGYKRGTKLFLTIRVMRLVFAAVVMLGLVRTFGS
ncbi:MAG TPA: hypothetical protein PLH94_08615 [Fimbriimonadaceae bacterium]|nr:hypothetical protein [Fimbriimonadaceae bacterium]